MFQRIDFSLALPALLLVIIGGVALSSVAPSAYPFHFIYLFVSILSFLLFANLNLKILKNLSPTLYIFCLILLVLTPIFGDSVRGSVRWIDFGMLTLQTSEIIKPFLLLFLSYLISSKINILEIKSLNKFVFVFLATLIPALLVFFQPDLGSTIVLFTGFFGVVFIGGLPTRTVILGTVSFFILLPIIWLLLAPYQKDRIYSFVNPQSDPLSSGYNSIQAKIAVGEGGFFGLGLGQGTQSQLLFLPEKHTDFIFAAISEELGFVGSFTILLTFGVLLLRLLILIKNSNDLFVKSFFGGLFFVFFVQAVVNIGMNIGLLPITGITLPFISSGGSSLLAMSISLGIASMLSESLRERRFSSIMDY